MFCPAFALGSRAAAELLNAAAAPTTATPHWLLAMGGLLLGALLALPVHNFLQRYLAALPARTAPPARGLIQLRILLPALGASGAAIGAFSPAPPGIALLEAALVALLVAACLTDLVCHRLPNRLLAGAGILAAADSGGQILFASPSLAIWLAPALVGIVMLVLSAVSGALGMGDAKLSLVLALWLCPYGWQTICSGLIYGFILGGLQALTLVATKHAHRHTQIAFGPALLIGACIAWA